VRAALFKVVEGVDVSMPPPLSNANLLINELIREYLDYNGYRYTMIPSSYFYFAITIGNLQAVNDSDTKLPAAASLRTVSYDKHGCRWHL
jgi:hypothetical protein